MYFLLFIPSYFRWHYSTSLKDLSNNLKNGFLFIPQFFSLSTLLRTIFSPWKRLGEEYHKGFDPSAFFSTAILNTILRIVGFVIRSVTIVISLVVLIFYTFAAITLYLVWLIFPAFLLFVLALGLKNLL